MTLPFIRKHLVSFPYRDVNMFLMGHSWPLLCLFLSFLQFFQQLTVNIFVIKFVDDWIRTAGVWNWKWPLCQASHNHCPLSLIGLNRYYDLQCKLAFKTVVEISSYRDCWMAKCEFPRLRRINSSRMPNYALLFMLYLTAAHESYKFEREIQI